LKVDMTELELTRTPEDRRAYALDGVGTLRLEGVFSRTATAEAAGQSWRFAHRGLWQRAMEATDAAGTAVGEFAPRSIRRGGALSWRGREYTLQPVSSFRERYVLSDGERDLALIHGKSWGKRPVKVTLGDPDAVDPALLLFAVFVVRQLASDADSSAGSSTATFS
jgi:hypothetical protein